MATRYVAEWIEDWEPETAPCDKTVTRQCASLSSAKTLAIRMARKFNVFPWATVTEFTLQERDRYWKPTNRWVSDLESWDDGEV